jgi:cell division protein FtsW
MRRAVGSPMLFQTFPKSDPRGKALLVITGIMVILGIVFVGSASEGQTVATGGSPASLIFHDVAYAIIGLLAFLLVSKVQLPILVRLSPWFLGGAVFLLTAVAVKGVTVNGGKRWLNASVVLFQPSEVFKLATVLFLAWGIQRFHNYIGRGYYLLWLLSPIFVGVLLILLEPDMGTASIVLAISLLVLIVAGMPRKFVGVAAALVAAGLIPFSTLQRFHYAWIRFTSFSHFGQFSNSLNYQIDQSKMALGSGGITGLGFGHSRAKWGLLPNPHTDFIFSILGEEMGLIGAVVVIALFALFVLVSVRIAAKCTNHTYRFMAIGITAWIALEALVNISSVVGWWAVTGIPLPFFSYGGTSLIVDLVAVGILYNIANDRTTSKDLTIREHRSAHTLVPLREYRDERVTRHRRMPSTTQYHSQPRR